MSSPDYVVIKIAGLPYYWREKIKGLYRRAPACPFDGGALAAMDEPEAHVQCVKCGRKYG